MKKLIVTLMLVLLPLSVMAMDAVTNSALDGVSGQAGVTIAFGSVSTTTIAFSSVAWGDPDGCAPAACAAAGWIIIDGNISIQQVIAAGETLVLDVGTSSGCTIPATTTVIPAGRSFVKVGLPTVTTTITVPATLTVGLGSTSQAITGTLGLLFLENLSVTAGTPSALYIWAH